MRLTDKQFGKLTLRSFTALVERKKQEDRISFIKLGTIVSNIVNFSMARPEKPVSALEFVPDWLKEGLEKEEFDLSTLSPEEQAIYVKQQFGKKQFVRRS